ncbi:Receptor-like protein 43 [Citrus sinensis]|nr:Receptor-like protein 43 [Citrus sinensis]
MRLSYLNLSGTSLSGQIPSEILKLSNLVSLDLSVNDVPGSRVELQKPSFENLVEKLSNLKTLDLCDVSIDSMIPHNIGNLSSLTFVSLRNYELQGRIPSSIGNLSKLLHLDISLNELQGELPISVGDLLGSIGNLRSLEAIYMSECNFSGQITSSLRNLTELLVLDMAQNSYGGTIELVLASILLPGNNGDLVTFDLSSNNLQGPLPVPPPGTVNYLAFSSSLTGEIPSWICNLNILESLVLSHNNLSGLLPQCLGNFSNELSVLDLQGNNFSGTIPNTFTKESRLGVMDLSHNLFQGRIPRSLINCSKLEFLGLGNNQISDTFPSWLGSLPKLNVVILRSNIFYGIIEEPRTGCGFSKFRIIDLSDNRFTGKLPSKSFLCWNAMKIVNASENNNLQGHIPSCLGNLTNLESLDLSNNKFSGRIPQQLVQLTFLEFFNVSDNYLTGLIPQGKQFATFDNTSLDRNSGFCGRPLSKECESGEPPTIEDHTERSEESLFSGASDENHSDWLCGRTCGRIGSRVQLQHGNYRMDSGEVGNAAKGNKEEEEDT